MLQNNDCDQTFIVCRLLSRKVTNGEYKTARAEKNIKQCYRRYQEVCLGLLWIFVGFSGFIVGISLSFCQLVSLSFSLSVIVFFCVSFFVTGKFGGERLVVASPAQPVS